MKPWDAEEAAWARDCFHAGDSFDEIAEGACRPVADVSWLLGSGRSLTALQREVVSLYNCGVQFEAIAEELGITGPNRRKAPATMITYLRRKGFPIPHRINMAVGQ